MGSSLFLLAQPSFLEGAARVGDFFDLMTEYNVSPTGETADSAALWADWSLIAEDLRVAARRSVDRIGHVEAKG